jgi:RNA polymerase sigma factor (sigma-70 family)
LTCTDGPGRKLVSPQPLLTRDEERELGKKAFAGDRTARDELVFRNGRLVPYYVGKFGGRGVERDELEAEASAALVEAATRFDPGSFPRTKFASFASHWIIGRLKTLCKKTSRFAGISGHGWDELVDPDSESSFEDRQIDRLWLAMEGMPASQREILVRRFGLHGTPQKTQRQLGAELGVSRQTMCGRSRKAMANLALRMNQIA